MQLKSLKHISPNNGLISVDEHGDLFEGYDGPLTYYEENTELTLRDRIEVAERMLLLWARWLGKWEDQFDFQTSNIQYQRPSYASNPDDDIPF